MAGIFAFTRNRNRLWELVEHANRIAVWGMSGGALLETHGVAGVGANAAIVARWRTRPLTPYLTVSFP